MTEKNFLQNKYDSEVTILPSMCDETGFLSRAYTFSLFMDLASLAARSLKLGPAEMTARGYFWIVVKTRFCFNRRPKLMDSVTISTWLQPHKKARCERDYLMTADDEVLLYGKTDWAVMDGDGRLVSLDKIYPEGLVFDIPSPFTGNSPRINNNYQNCRVIGSYKVRSVDLDFAGHMNNAVYAKALMGIFSTQELGAMKNDDIEIVFSRSAHEGDVLTYYLTNTDGCMEICAVKQDGEVSMLARIR